MRLHHLIPLAAHLVLSISTPQQRLLLPTVNRKSISPDLFTSLEELARIVDITYCVGTLSPGITEPFACLSRCADFPSFQLVKTWNTGPLLSDSCGYIALDHEKKRIIVAFRGTYSIANTIVDLSSGAQEYVPYPGSDDEDGGETQSTVKCGNCTVHTGFYTAWLHTREEILEDLSEQRSLFPDYEVNLVGHSLGGAVAALAALDLQASGWNPLVTTFGEPRVGNSAFVRFLDEQFSLLPSNNVNRNADAWRYRRVTHLNDPVPLLPPTEMGFAMHAGEIFISKSSLTPDIEDLQACHGDNDQECIAGQDATTADPEVRASASDLLASVKEEIEDVKTESWGIPARYRLWQLLFAHRDYFWRLGTCVPKGGWLGGDRLARDVDDIVLKT